VRAEPFGFLDHFLRRQPRGICAPGEDMLHNTAGVIADPGRSHGPVVAESLVELQDTSAAVRAWLGIAVFRAFWNAAFGSRLPPD